MENLIATSILVFVFYAWLFVPKKASQKVTITQDKNNTKAIQIVERLPQSKFKKPSENKKDKKDLSKLTIRELKKLASIAKIAKYGNLRKHELIKVLE